MRYSFNKQSYKSAYLLMIFKRIRKVVLLFPIFVVLGLIALILGLTVLKELIPYSIFAFALGIVIGIYVLVLYYKTSSNLNNAYDMLSMGGDLEYELSVEGSKVVLHNLSLNQVAAINIEDVDLIYTNKKAYVVFCKDGFNFLVPNNEQGKDIIDSIKLLQNNE